MPLTKEEAQAFFARNSYAKWLNGLSPAERRLLGAAHVSAWERADALESYASNFVGEMVARVRTQIEEAEDQALERAALLLEFQNAPMTDAAALVRSLKRKLEEKA